MNARLAGHAEPHPAKPSGGARLGLTPGQSLDVCPLLRSADGSWSSVFASRELRCWAIQPAAQPSVAKQRQLCVAPAHVECSTYRVASAPDPAIPSFDGSLLWPARASVPISLEPAHGRPGISVSSRRAGGQALLVVLMLVAFVVLALARTSPLGGGTASSTLAPRSPAPASGLAAASATAVPTPTATVEATASAGPSASGGDLTPSPSTSARTYRVRAGDTLAVIAAKFHTTVKAIVAANQIVDPRTIHAGQVLLIP